MRSDALDITIETRSSMIWLTLSGPFHNEQIPSMREKFVGLLEDGNRHFVVNLEGITTIDDQVASFFMSLLNLIKGKYGGIRFVFKNETVYRAFAPYSNLLSIYPDIAALESGKFLWMLKRRSSILSRKTGVRLSRPVALFLLFVLCGWFISLAFIIHIQSQRIKEQQTELHDLQQYRQRTQIELTALRERIRPLEQLGIIKDTNKVKK